MVYEMDKKTAVSIFLSYLLRHDPIDLDMNKQGFVPLQQILKKVQTKFPEVDKSFIERLIQEGNTRFQLKDNQIRALYGHSIPVKIQRNKNDNKTILYHGTSKNASKKILKQGLKPKGRNKVHLSTSLQEAIRVGKRHCKKPVILFIDAKKASEKGIYIEKATENVYLTDYIPPDCIFRDEEHY